MDYRNILELLQIKIARKRKEDPTTISLEMRQTGSKNSAQAVRNSARKRDFVAPPHSPLTNLEWLPHIWMSVDICVLDWSKHKKEKSLRRYSV
jgi:hypothetical protein